MNAPDGITVFQDGKCVPADFVLQQQRACFMVAFGEFWRFHSEDATNASSNSPCGMCCATAV